MGFVVIPGSFRLIGKTRGFEPDGDSMHFAPDNPKLLDQLTVIQQPVRLSTIGSVQLRFEGIDALELHFAGAAHHQPRPLADDSRDWLTATLGPDPVTYAPPGLLTVKAPAPNDGHVATSCRDHSKSTGGPSRSCSRARHR